MTSYLHIPPSPLGHFALISMRPATCAVPPAEVLHRQTYERVTCVYNIYYVRALAPFGCKGTTFIWNTQGFWRFFSKKIKIPQSNLPAVCFACLFIRPFWTINITKKKLCCSSAPSSRKSVHFYPGNDFSVVIQSWMPDNIRRCNMLIICWHH